MSNNSFDQLIGNVGSFFDFVGEAAAIGAETAAANLEAITQATDRYRNDTGATRASTLAYVADRQDDQIDQAIAAGESLNPGESVIEQAAASDDQAITVVLTAFMRYDDPLEARVEFIGHALETGAENAAAVIFESIGEAFE